MGMWTGIVFSLLWNVFMGRSEKALKEAEGEQS